jgi:transcriptional regulator GlxA family with amidase domain
VTREVVILAWPGCVALDVVGPHDALSDAAALAGGYRVRVAAAAAGPVRTASALVLHAELAFDDLGSPDTVIVAGGPLPALAASSGPVLACLRGLSARRVASVCTGAFLLAGAGLLAGRRATTHWRHAATLAARFPDVRVEPDAIYVQDGPILTSAGVTAGIDLSLALIEADLGVAVARAVARDLVVFLRRPGGQSQHSALMQLTEATDDRLARVQRWIPDNLSADLSVEALARRAAMSPRNFTRRFRAETGETPARFVELARLEGARLALERGDLGLEQLASELGFQSAEVLRRAFVRRFGVAPSVWRRHAI